jgi:hypothetical protein
MNTTYSLYGNSFILSFVAFLATFLAFVAEITCTQAYIL